MSPVLSVTGISKRFGPVPVLRDVGFTAEAGEVHALLGGNGAGKSTLMKIVAGLIAPDAGSVAIGGVPMTLFTPVAAQRAGVTLVPQEAQLFPNQSVLDNITLGLPHPPAALRAEVAALVSGLGVSLDLDARAAGLEIADRQIVEILRGMIRKARVLILDEPTASLTPLEVAALFTRVRALRAAGVGIVFISHKLHELREIADRITVLRDGQVVLQAGMASVTDAAILEAMSPGLTTAGDAPHQAPATAAPLLMARDLSGEGFADISLALHPGEILGLAGAVGAGRTELAEALVGLRPSASGRLEIDGAPVALPRWTLRRAIDAGVVLLPEDRGRHGLFLEAPLAWNTGVLRMPRMPLLLRRAREARDFDGWRHRLGIRCAGPRQNAGRLSGGNQQKLLLAKCLAAKPRVLILDEPTRGVDAGARADIYTLIRQIAAEGTAVMVVSSDFDEVSRLADRILVMAAGRLAGELRGGADPRAIGRLAFESREASHA